MAPLSPDLNGRTRNFLPALQTEIACILKYFGLSYFASTTQIKHSSLDFKSNAFIVFGQ
jgi:hypothetical protein